MSVSKPLCTVIIPTIGRPKYFGAALASVAAQTYHPLNILVSDNAAKPPIDHAEIHKLAPANNVRLVRCPTRLAGAEHINLCLKEADGEYLLLMSDDDLIAPGYVSAAMECILRDPDVNVVVSKQTQIDENFLKPVCDFPIDFKALPGNEYVTRWFTTGGLGVLTVFPMLARRLDILECGGLPNYPYTFGEEMSQSRSTNIRAL